MVGVGGVGGGDDQAVGQGGGLGEATFGLRHHRAAHPNFDLRALDEGDVVGPKGLALQSGGHGHLDVAGVGRGDDLPRHPLPFLGVPVEEGGQGGRAQVAFLGVQPLQVKPGGVDGALIDAALPKDGGAGGTGHEALTDAKPAGYPIAQAAGHRDGVGLPSPEALGIRQADELEGPIPLVGHLRGEGDGHVAVGGQGRPARLPLLEAGIGQQIGDVRLGGPAHVSHPKGGGGLAHQLLPAQGYAGHLAVGGEGQAEAVRSGQGEVPLRLRGQREYKDREGDR